ncbi:MAG: alpha/beta fold hydrolase [Dehalococcoidia bacterium]|nr:alpha/beta fold hydrolase [Dehalococcoidia bacterium]
MIVLGLVFAIVLIVALHGLGALYIADTFTRSKRRRVQGTPADLGLRYEEIQFLTADRLTLRGWFLESPGARATVVLVHDLEGTRASPEHGLLRLQRDYVRRGYNVFAFDLRGHGESGGRRDCLGSCERQDVQAAVAYVRRRTGSLPIVLHGFGLGASLAITAVASRGGPEVAGIIADSPIASMRTYLKEAHRHIPPHVFMLACRFARRFFGADVDALKPIAVVEGVRVPILFVHCQGDPRVPLAHTHNLTAASLDPRNEVWTVPDILDHCGAYPAAPQDYVRQSLGFIDRVVPARLLAAQAV